MGGLAALLHLDRSPAAPGEVEPLLQSLCAPRPASPSVLRVNEWASVAALPRGTREEPLGVAVSAPNAPGRLIAALDGRIDNRSTLWERLGVEKPRSAVRTDAELLVAGFERWHDELFEHAIGPFAALIIDLERAAVCIARDPTGGRSLFFRRHGPILGIASRPSALFAIGNAPLRFDETSIARYFALRGPAPGSTFFAEIHEAPAGAVLRLTHRESRNLRTVRIEPAPRPGRGTESDYEDRFRQLLDQAVDRCLPNNGGVAISLSGGLDSTSVAATAAQLLGGRSQPPPVCISWTFRELDGIDETYWIEAANRASGARQVLLPSDDLWPLSDESSWPRPIDSPFLDPYWRLREKLLEQARAAGCSVVLNGESGDELWLGAFDWLRDLTSAGRYGEAAAAIARALTLRARGRRLRHPLLGSMRRLFPASKEATRTRSTPWLTPWARQLLQHDDPTAARETDADLRLSLALASYSSAALLAATYGLEVRRPFRDRDLIELFLGIPPRWLYRPGAAKRLLRRALRDRLPPEILQRTTATSFLPLADRGLRERGWPLLAATLASSESTWPKYVDQAWIRKDGVPALGTARDGAERVVLWHCYGFERWLRALTSALAGAAPVR